MAKNGIKIRGFMVGLVLICAFLAYSGQMAQAQAEDQSVISSLMTNITRPVTALETVVLNALFELLGSVATLFLYVFVLIFRALDRFVVGGGSLILTLIADVIFTGCQMLGSIAVELWLGVKLVVGGILGFFGTILGLIPIVGLVTGIAAAVLYGIWAAVFVFLYFVCVLTPIFINTVIGGAISTWGGINWYNGDLNVLNGALNVLAFAGIFTPTMAAGVAGAGTMGWCGGLGIGLAWVGDICITSIIELILLPVATILSLLLFAARLYNILPLTCRLCVMTCC